MGNLISLARGNQNPENAMQASNARYTQRLSLKAESTVGSVVTSPRFDPDIKILSTGNEWILAIGLLDTQCRAGNWISRRLVERLGKSSSVSVKFVNPGVVNASGTPVTPCGVVDLEWKWHPHGTRVHVSRFYVFPFSPQLDVVFGAEFIAREGLLRVNEMAFIPLVQDKKSKKGDEAAIEQAKKRQQEEKAALEERRKQEKQQS